MYFSQLALLGLEAAVMAALVLGLFRARSVLGLSPLYIVIGGFQYLEATLSLQVELWPGFAIYPGSSVMFTTNLFAVLLVYLKEDALEARKLVYGLVLANAGLTVVSLLVSAHFVLPGVAPGTTMTAAEFINNAQIAVVGAALLFVDVIGIILVYEFVSRHTSFVFVRILVALLAIVAFDNFFFAGYLRFGRPSFIPTMVAGLISKAGAVLFYSAALWLYLRFVEPREVAAYEGDVADVFQMLTYRQKYEQARERMIQDPLTGLHNRLHFDDVVPRALAHARRYDEPISLMIVDGDGFKGINDRFSHLEGDRVLKLMGATIAAEIRAADIACRYGGDEFVIVLPRTNVEEARTLAERVQVHLREACAFASPPHPWGSITVTIGIASCPSDGRFETVDELIRLADVRLYEGKRSGGNRIVSNGSLDTPRSGVDARRESA
ncbi:MAG: GGDEF domain-containing protein [Acidobacteriota bacterium]|nr:GGDEF domain-containing protein [Acidobacteriota bacterium]